MSFLDGLAHGLATYEVETFYYLARTCLVKDETAYDRFDQAFAEYFRGVEQIPGLDADIPEEWLKLLAKKHLTDEEKNRLEKLGFDKLMEEFRKRLEEQKGRHAGGSKWIGTGGSSPFGNGGYHPEGIRVGGESAGNRTAVKVWEQREFKNVSDFDNDVEGNGRALLRINGHCNMSCAFCFVDRTVPDFDEADLLSQIERMAARDPSHLVLSGGEPTLHPALPRLIARATELGFREVEIQTNGVKAADADYAKALVDAGLSKVTVSLHSVDPERSDKITRLTGGFAKTVAAMHNFRALGVRTQVAHVITKANHAELLDTVRFLRTQFPEREGHLSICFGVAQPTKTNPAMPSTTTRTSCPQRLRFIMA